MPTLSHFKFASSFSSPIFNLLDLLVKQLFSNNLHIVKFIFMDNNFYLIKNIYKHDVKTYHFSFFNDHIVMMSAHMSIEVFLLIL